MNKKQRNKQFLLNQLPENTEREIHAADILKGNRLNQPAAKVQEPRSRKKDLEEQIIDRQYEQIGNLKSQVKSRDELVDDLKAQNKILEDHNNTQASQISCLEQVRTDLLERISKLEKEVEECVNDILDKAWKEYSQRLEKFTEQMSDKYLEDLDNSRDKCLQIADTKLEEVVEKYQRLMYDIISSKDEEIALRDQKIEILEGLSRDQVASCDERVDTTEAPEKEVEALQQQLADLQKAIQNLGGIDLLREMAKDLGGSAGEKGTQDDDGTNSKDLIEDAGGEPGGTGKGKPGKRGFFKSLLRW